MTWLIYMHVHVAVYLKKWGSETFGKKEMTNVKDVLHKNEGLPLITYHQS